MFSGKVIFVAEVSSNHNQDLERCLKFVDVAADIGCDAVKFQLFRLEELFAPEILKKSEEHRKRKHWELPLDFLPAIHNRCKDNRVMFACTPAYLRAVEELEPYVDFYKIASYELLWDDLLIQCAKTRKPVVLSTGMATLDEIANAIKMLREGGCNKLGVLHTVSSYPTPIAECNLSAIETIRKLCSGCFPDIDINVGWSDHSVSPGVIFRAVHKWDAFMIEFHLDIDGKGAEFYGGHCWLPDDIRVVIQHVREGFDADGSGVKEPALSELADRDWRRDPNDGLRPLLAIRN